MGEESVNGARMGVLLIIFAAILALGLIIFMLARNMANEGLTSTSEKLEAASQSEYTDFDQKIVVGQRVQSALSSFKGKKVAVLIATQAVTDKVATAYSSTGITSSLMTTKAGTFGADGAMTTAGVLQTTAVVRGHEKAVFAFGAKYHEDATETNRTALAASSSGKTGDKVLTFVQYNALLEPTNNLGVVDGTGKVTAVGDMGGNSVICWRDDHYVFSGAFRSDTGGKTILDTIYTNTSKTGMTEMIPNAARFNANLLKDENGVILGVVFQQVGA
jgi:hypothetical protein